MGLLQFENAAVWRNCCDLAHMRDRFGPDAASKISLRLQQLEAIVAVEDLEFLPFHSRPVGGGFEVSVTDTVSLLFETAQSEPGAHSMLTIKISKVLTSATMETP